MDKPKKPNYYRQQFLLSVVGQSDGELSKRDLQKLLFLVGEEAGLRFYDFIPYHYGCFSFQAQSDLELMLKRGWISVQDSKIRLNHETDWFFWSESSGRFNTFFMGTGKLRSDDLVKYVYEEYPYFAINSRIRREILGSDSLTRVEQARSQLIRDERVLFTIGYEGISFEQYVNKLIRNDVRLLCDVRRNAASRKFGFSKTMLSKVLPEIGISYIHIPSLGVESDSRKRLIAPDDYKRLFLEYKKRLPSKGLEFSKLNSLISEYNRVALTCFERKFESCHRHCVSDYLERERNLEVCHL